MTDSLPTETGSCDRKGTNPSRLVRDTRDPAWICGAWQVHEAGSHRSCTSSSSLQAARCPTSPECPITGHGLCSHQSRCHPSGNTLLSLLGLCHPTWAPSPPCVGSPCDRALPNTCGCPSPPPWSDIHARISLCRKPLSSSQILRVNTRSLPRALTPVPGLPPTWKPSSPTWPHEPSSKPVTS